jgi:hypothetical protein
MVGEYRDKGKNNNSINIARASERASESGREGGREREREREREQQRSPRTWVRYTRQAVEGTVARLRLQSRRTNC